jgi:hypothetical protein
MRKDNEGLANVLPMQEYLIFKILRVGKVPVEGTEVSYNEEAFLEAGICPVITSRNAVYLLRSACP